LFNFSDIRLKTDIQDIKDAIETIKGLQGKKYKWKDNEDINESRGGKRLIGLIAQEVQRILPEVVEEDAETGLLSVSYSEIVPILIEAFKQHLRDFQIEKTQMQAELKEISKTMKQLKEENKMYSPIIDKYLKLQTSNPNKFQFLWFSIPFPRSKGFYLIAVICALSLIFREYFLELLD